MVTRAAPNPPPDDATQDPLRRLVSLRWLSILIMLCVALGAKAVFGVPVPTAAILLITLTLAAWNLLTWHQAPAATASTTLMELLVDLAAWASFLYLTGGATNPMASLLLPLIAVGATVLPMRHAWLIAGIAVVIYIGLWFIHRPLRLPDPEQAAMWHLAGMEATFAVSAAVVVWYVARLTQAIRQRDRSLAQAREHALRNERLLALANQAASAAHELSTPLASMRLLVTELLPRAGDAETREDLQLVDQQIEQCKTILSRLSDTAGRARATDALMQPLDHWISKQIEVVRTQCPEARIMLKPLADPGTIRADSALDHAVHNLLTNAIKAAPGQAVELALEQRGRMVDVRILDRGPGLPPSLQAIAIAEPNRGLPSEGLGIGLLLTQAAIEAHGGSLAFQERPGGGTIAIMTLPTVSP